MSKCKVYVMNAIKHWTLKGFRRISSHFIFSLYSLNLKFKLFSKNPRKFNVEHIGDLNAFFRNDKISVR